VEQGLDDNNDYQTMASAGLEIDERMLRGVRTSYLLPYLRGVAGGNEELTMGDAMMKAVKEYPSAVVDSLDGKKDDDGKNLVAQSTLFVSHAWRYPLLDLVEALDDWTTKEKKRDAYVWLDVMCVNQHDAEAQPQEFWTKSFKSAVGRIGTVLLVLAPWDKPIPLTRIWCLFEVASAIEAKAEVHVAMPPTQVEAFWHNVVEGDNLGECPMHLRHLMHARQWRVSRRIWP